MQLVFLLKACWSRNDWNEKKTCPSAWLGFLSVLLLLLLLLLKDKIFADERRREATVKPVLSNHPTVQGKVVVKDRWSLKEGFPKQTDFSKLCWTVTNVVVRTRLIYVMTIHVNLVQAVASCDSFLANLRCGGCFDSKYGDKATLFLAFGR